MSITVVFDPPLPSDNPATFNQKAFTLLGNLNTWSTQANALASDSSGFMAVPFLFRLQERDSLILLAPSPHWRWPVASKFAQS